MRTPIPQALFSFRELPVMDMIFRVSTNNLYDMGYNHLNLPTEINADGAVISYTYDANGNKLKKLVAGNASVNNEYIRAYGAT